MPYKIFIDTQYTNVQRPKLISFGACTERGRMFYVELEGDWDNERYSLQVMADTIPALSSSKRLKEKAAGLSFAAWLQSIDAPSLELVSLHTLDRDLVCGIEGFLLEVNRLGLRMSHLPIARVEGVDAEKVLDGVRKFFSDGPAIADKTERQHSLNGAIALRYGFNLTVGMAEFAAQAA